MDPELDEDLDALHCQMANAFIDLANRRGSPS